MDFLKIPTEILNNSDMLYTFTLLFARFTGLFFLLPGIGGSGLAMAVRAPAIMIFSMVSLVSSAKASLPADSVMMVAAYISEVMFGALIGLIPYMIVISLQTGMQIASTSMGLGASQLLDPTSGAQVSDISRILGDTSIVLFLLLGGHHFAIHAVAGFGGDIIPGTFRINDLSIELLVTRSAQIFQLGVVIAAPVLVALMLTQFVMGMLSKAVPTINVFIIAFPLTIGIGLILTVLAFGDIMHVMTKELISVAGSYEVLQQGYQQVK